MDLFALVREYFPLFSDDHLGKILFTCTAFPCTTDEAFLRNQLASIQTRSCGLYHRAMEIAHDDLDRAMEKRVNSDR